MTDAAMNKGANLVRRARTRSRDGAVAAAPFHCGRILGTGIYALTGQIAKQVGGVVWLPFVVAFVVALITAFTYLELATKYPNAQAPCLTRRAFGIRR